jgi:hypothetical protein
VQEVVAVDMEGKSEVMDHNSPFAVTTIVGLDDSAGAYSVLYADARGVFRVYQMSLTGGVWKMWREAPGFRQRFVSTFSGYWEKSEDGANSEHDFDLSYTRALQKNDA